MKNLIALSILFTPLLGVFSQKHLPRFNEIDVLNYGFEIEVNDSTNVIQANALIHIKFKSSVSSFSMDLVNLTKEGKGMTVSSIMENDKLVPFTHENNQLKLLISPAQISEVRKYSIRYAGIPADGLIISKNKYGDRTFFGDNWPDRGQNWLPLVDHPSDKATVEWVVVAPAKYESIANGTLLESAILEGNRKRSIWRMNQPIAPKVMVCAVADFAVMESGQANGVDVSAWVYPQNEHEGFQDYQQAIPITNYFIEQIGPFPFDKLANVQSTTRFGGMENASCIFYAEESVTGTGSCEALIAHEVAHQWFGNSATEATWHDIWLSEGFATYFTNLYFEKYHGSIKFKERIENERAKVIRFYKNNRVPVVNPKIENYLELLNANSYEKGAMILHMLRRELGDETFWLGIRKYYQQYQFSNATSANFQSVMEQVSGVDLSQFFHQWLNEVGHPELQIQWNSKGKLKIKQVQNQYTFHFPLDLKITYESGATRSMTTKIDSKKNKINIKGASAVKSVEIDPEKWLLFEMR